MKSKPTKLKPMPGPLLIVKFKELSEQSRRLTALAHFWGIETTVIPVCALGSIELSGSLLVVDAVDLGKSLDAGSFDTSLRDRLLGQRSQLLIHSLCPNPAARMSLRWITGDRSADIHEVDTGSEYIAVPEAASIQEELAGTRWGPANKAIDFGLSFSDSSFQPVIKLGDFEFLTTGLLDDCNVFLLANTSLLDLDSPAVEGKTLKNVCAKFVPIRMVLRSVFGDRCWHVDRHRANLVIDDPYLRQRYGGLSIPGLVDTRSN